MNQLLADINLQYPTLGDIISLMIKPRNIRPNFIQLYDLITVDQNHLSKITEHTHESGESIKNPPTPPPILFNSNQIDDLEVRIDFSQQNYELKNKLRSHA